MKQIIILVVLSCMLLYGCKTATVYVPVESVRTEYKDRIFRDSLFVHDSILVRTVADTVYFEKYKTIYRDKLLRDSVFLTDTIRVPYPVEVVREVNRLKGWQNFLLWCGGISCIIALLYIYFKR